MPRRRAKSRTNASVTLFALVILFILGIYYALTGRDGEVLLGMIKRIDPASVRYPLGAPKDFIALTE